jgi:RNA polymerase sigma-70 factor (ECF subfamily)
MASLPAQDDADRGTAPGVRDWTVAMVRTRPGGFECAYGELYGEVADYVYRRTGDADATEDLVADVFLSAFDALPRVRRRGVPFRFWLFRIATNRVHRWWRSTRRRERLAALFGREEARRREPEPVADPRADELSRTLRRLGPRHQAVLSLHYLEGLPIEEIAEILDCAPGTVKSRLSRARAAYLQRLDEDRSDTR